MYFNATQPKTASIKETVVLSSHNSDAFNEYVCKIESIDKEIDILKQEINVLEKYLKKMENSLRRMKGSLEKIFVAKYIDGLSVNKIAIKVNYSESHVYRQLSIINQIIKDDKK